MKKMSEREKMERWLIHRLNITQNIIKIEYEKPQHGRANYYVARHSELWRVKNYLRRSKIGRE